MDEPLARLMPNAGYEAGGVAGAETERGVEIPYPLAVSMDAVTKLGHYSNCGAAAAADEAGTLSRDISASALRPVRRPALLPESQAPLHSPSSNSACPSSADWTAAVRSPPFRSI